MSSLEPFSKGDDLNPLKPWRGYVLVSPDVAERWLQVFNLSNRRLRQNLIEYLVKEIREGTWDPDHPNPIVFSTKRLIDGQHRLYAVVKSKSTLIMHAWCGVDDNKRECIDTGITRTLEDRITFCDDLHDNGFAAQIVSQWFRQTVRNNIRPTPVECTGLFEKHRDAILFGISFLRKKQRGITRLPVIVALCEMYERNKELAQQFANSLLVVDGDIQPARVFRDYLLRNVGRGGTSEITDQYLKAIGAMRACLDGREIKAVRCANW